MRLHKVKPPTFCENPTSGDFDPKHSGDTVSVVQSRVSVLNFGALAPEWLFWTSLWRQKNSGAGRIKKVYTTWRKNLGKTFII